MTLAMLNQGLSLFKKAKYFAHLKYRYLLDVIGFRITVRNPINNIQIAEFRGSFHHSETFLKQLSNTTGLIIPAAEKIMQHEFYYLGKRIRPECDSTPTHKGYQLISWHYDPIAKVQHPNHVWYRHIRQHVKPGSDLKYPWELSRFQHLTQLGSAYNLSGDEKYTKEFVNQVCDWIDHNPVRYGIHWSNSMEVGIRSANWLVALQLFIDSPLISDKFLVKLLKSLQEHGSHIYNNLENLQTISSNHLIGDLFGLFYLANLVPQFHQSKQWAKYSRKNLEREMLVQTDKDGWDYEGSTAYHKLVTEMFTFVSVLAEHIKKPFSPQFNRRLSKMIGICSLLEGSDGKIPQIGDNDSGFAFNYVNGHDNLHVKNLVSLAKNSRIISASDPVSGEYNFQTSGHYITKTDRVNFHFITGPKELLGIGSHMHNDRLSYIFRIDGNEILVDPGTYVYSSDPIKRNLFRSASSHNTLFWKQLEPRSLDDGLFQLKEKGSMEMNVNIGEKGDSYYSALYKYENRFHERSVSVSKKKNQIKIHDSCSHGNAFLNFNFAPGILPQINGNTIVAKNVIITFKGIRRLTLEKSVFSAGYGQIQDNHSVLGWIENTEAEHIITW
jgi:hypothetical protein